MYKAFEKWLNGVLEENMPIPEWPSILIFTKKPISVGRYN